MFTGKILKSSATSNFSFTNLKEIITSEPQSVNEVSDLYRLCYFFNTLPQLVAPSTFHRVTFKPETFYSSQLDDKNRISLFTGKILKFSAISIYAL